MNIYTVIASLCLVVGVRLQIEDCPASADAFLASAVSMTVISAKKEVGK